MSASLVGSEMCIRDRWSPGRSPKINEIRANPIKSQRDSTKIHRGCLSPCLLYTSDAADDM
eukprot:12738656-Alexandrium_andersonii.AAC.1